VDHDVTNGEPVVRAVRKVVVAVAAGVGAVLLVRRGREPAREAVRILGARLLEVADRLGNGSYDR
jgi:hypothetical protein